MIKKQTLTSELLNTPLGEMIAIADDKTLYLLEFIDRKNLEKGIEKLKDRTKLAIIPGMAEPIRSVKAELQNYFDGTLKEFKTPVTFSGSLFQESVWQELQKIPAGQTRSYAQIAQAIKKPLAWRAVANAHGANQLALIIPCHRVTSSHNKLGGYAGGIQKKEWLLNHEKNIL